MIEERIEENNEIGQNQEIKQNIKSIFEDATFFPSVSGYNRMIMFKAIMNLVDKKNFILIIQSH